MADSYKPNITLLPGPTRAFGGLGLTPERSSPALLRYMRGSSTAGPGSEAYVCQVKPCQVKVSRAGGSSPSSSSTWTSGWPRVRERAFLDGRLQVGDLTLSLLQVPLQPVDAAEGVLEREVLSRGQLLGPLIGALRLLGPALEQVIAVGDLSFLAFELALQARYLSLGALPAAPATPNLLLEVPDACLQFVALALQGLDMPLPRLFRGAGLVHGEAGGGDLLVELPYVVVFDREPGRQLLGV